MKKSIIKLCGILATALLFAGCFGGTAKTTSNELPKWYITPPNNNAMFLYGAGEGYSKDEAKRNALLNLVAKLSVSIESKFESKTKVESGEFNSLYKKTQQDIKSEVSKIRVSNYEIVKSTTQEDGNILMLVRSDREKFYNSLKKELDIKIKKLQNALSNNAKANVLKRYAFYKNASKSLSAITSNVLVMDSLNDSFDEKPYLKVAQQVNNEFEKLKTSMNFSIITDKNSLKLADPIRVALTDKNIKVVKKPISDDSLIISITSRVKNVKSYGMDIAKFAVNISIKDTNNNIIGGNKINLKGIASQGAELAQEEASKNLQKKIKKEGIGKVLGIDF